MSDWFHMTDFTWFMLWKGLAICALAFLIPFIYGLVTGKSLLEARRERRDREDR